MSIPLEKEVFTSTSSKTFARSWRARSFSCVSMLLVGFGSRSIWSKRWGVGSSGLLQHSRERSRRRRSQSVTGLSQTIEGTVGRLYHEHMCECGTPLPGVRGSPVEPICCLATVWMPKEKYLQLHLVRAAGVEIRLRFFSSWFASSTSGLKFPRLRQPLRDALIRKKRSRRCAVELR